MSYVQPIRSERTIPLTTRLLRQYATAIATPLFVIVAVTGVLLFFHLQEQLVKSAHEWLGLAFVLSAAVHVLRNWSAFAGLLTKMRTVSIFVMVMAISGVFFVSAGAPGEGRNPRALVMGAVERAPLSAVAPILGQSADQMIEQLRSAGFAVSGPDDSLAKIGAAGNVRLPELLRVVLVDTSAPRPEAATPVQ
ncbi:DUF4405 domain-containing protein [Telmatospirillum sp.]|uniref:DUF4405 domain-containing protein n=1 Tax=Telmatospirillum sp. TaxID=2079197 RepID=UPI00284878D0|nr:DUF4405 domain-containing protein [Telmatospirillum sp.]MDR3438645.1 DUF4405 domain-containing protein [Telmatospirillum sp.]